MTRLKNMNVHVYIQCQYTRTILKKKNMGQSSLNYLRDTQHFKISMKYFTLA